VIDRPLPAWWTDIERSRNEALAELESVLTALESTLIESSDKSPDSVKKRFLRWSELTGASRNAANRLSSVARLAESRRLDVIAMDLSPPQQSEVDKRASAASRRLTELSSELKRQMSLTSDEISRRQPRRPRTWLYSENTPSHIDVHV
jgi:hypothetical protein